MGVGKFSNENESPLVRQEGKEAEVLEKPAAVATVPLPPDGGWGWVVVAASFLIFVILDGILFSFGILFIELLECFNESKGKTVLVGALQMGMHLIFAPVTSILVNRFNIRKVAMAGSVLTTGALVASVFAPSINVLMFTFGILGGIGISLAYIPTILVVGFYFDKRRALANGISNSGSGIGAFVFGPLTVFLCNEYSWRGCLLIIAGIVFNCTAFSALFYPLPVVQPPKSNSTSTISTDTDTTKDSLDAEDTGPLLRKPPLAVPRLSQLRRNSIKTSMSQGDISLPSLNASSLLPQLTVQTDSITNLDGSVVSRSTRDLHYVPSHPPTKAAHYSMDVIWVPPRQQNHPAALPTLDEQFFNKPLSRKDIFYSGSIQRLPEYQVTNGREEYTASILRLPEPEVEPTPQHLVDRSCCSCWSSTKTAVFKSPMLYIYIISAVLWTTHSSVLNALPHYTELTGHSTDKAAIVVCIIGVMNVFGRLMSGALVDKTHISAIWLNMGVLLVGGASVVCLPFTKNYAILIAEVAVFGTCMGTWTSLRPIVIVELMGIEHLTQALGLVAFFQGIAFCTGSPVMGALFDLTESYTLPLILAAIAFVISGLFCIPMRMLARRHLFRDIVLERAISTSVNEITVTGVDGKLSSV